MSRAWIVLLTASLLAGVGMSRLAPARWGLAISQGLVLGSALYFGALHRFVMKAGGGRGGRHARTKMLAGLLSRAAFFLALAALQAAVCFEWMPGLDVRFGYVIAATWLFALSLIDPPAPERERSLGRAVAAD